MAVTVALSRSTASVAVGDYIDLVVTALDDGVPVSSQAVTVASSDTSKARAFAGLAKLPARTGGWGITASYPAGTSPSGTPITRITEDTSSAPHEGEWAPVTNFPADSTVVGVVEVKDTAGRGFIHVGFSDGSTVTGAIITVSTGALTNYGSTGTVLSGSRDLGGGWWQVWVAWTKSTTNAPIVVAGPSQSTTYSGSWTGSASYHIDVGLVSMLEPSATNTSGQSTARLLGVATGTSNVNATVSSVTSSNTVVTTIPASSLVLAVDEPAPARDDYIKATAPGAVVEFDLDPISQPASGTNIVIEYDASNTGSAIRVEVLDPRVY
jgi:hypothetical protein